MFEVEVHSLVFHTSRGPIKVNVKTAQDSLPDLPDSWGSGSGPSLQGDKRAALGLRVALGLAGFADWGTSAPLSHTLREPPHPPAPIHPEVKGCSTEGRVAAASTVRSGAPGSRGGGAAWAPRGAPPEAA
ncbi:hypothetical protein J1605_005694 [Eschrichtius robustus]|uniref:Uncharacterized protein n=1 Tax=Eschrichtius robustus TaxID=9764 RepID=A0AB34H9A7_ESCRO|nr:hypothetical protein J1605_005694 [Eschrichtius robustus]